MAKSKHQPFKLEVIERRVGRRTVLEVRRGKDNAPPPLRGRRVIPQRDYSAACYDGDGHESCIMQDCQCPCHQRKR